ncbi:MULTISPECIES: hypothetical protein [unclassified Rhizobium]|uniref:hypothetical protein n=1 Tax=unclassified Rhizobium TaxID=2613769 RepID=UPI00160A792C|nr:MULTISPECIES: hypothetical protein [unclassified Rhizobium]MBB3288752.1 hypothetical protein [Rhizobium sp. BK252]MBB3403494.1 hypothetical protein [Rhizobium sp. BK289]MBB3416321.1 hypothetical protein [Rhizobium sp. BK284]MBB3483957.1 hypothetical protein [Rhizobium sp. BK347]
MSNDLVVSSGALPTADNPSSEAHHVPPSTSSLTRAEIERIRDTDIDRYFAEGLDRRLLRITAAEMGSTEPTEFMPVNESRSAMMETSEGAQLVMQLERMGTFNHQIQQIQNTIASFVRDLGDHRHQKAFMERFDQAIPEAVRYRIYMQIAMGAPSFVVPVGDDDIEHFSSKEAGKSLVSEWGSRAAEGIAIVWKRMDYLHAEIGSEPMGFVVDWFESLVPSLQKRLLKFIATGK